MLTAGDALWEDEALPCPEMGNLDNLLMLIHTDSLFVCINVKGLFWVCHWLCFHVFRHSAFLCFCLPVYSFLSFQEILLAEFVIAVF